MGKLIRDNCRCICPEGYEGENCEIKTPCNNGFNNWRCNYNGQIAGHLLDDDCHCECYEGYIGEFCDEIE